MPHRTVIVDGVEWEISPTGRITQYTRDEFGLFFRRRSGGPGATRVARYAPLGVRRPEESLAELSERELRELLAHSQPAWTAPETGYAR